MQLGSPFLDRRTKLLPCQREMVLYWTKQGLSQRNIAKMFGVSRSLIRFVQDPDKQERNIQLRHERGGSKIYYKGGEEWAKIMREHRRYKHNVLKDKKEGIEKTMNKL